MSVMRDRRRSARLQREQEALDATRRKWHSPNWIAWCLIILASIILFSLSLWQVQRLDWKMGLIREITRHQQTQAQEGLPENIGNIQNTLSFARFRLTGEFLHESEIHLAARYYNSQLGYHILTPFQLEDGRIVLVNRGWVPADNKEADTRPDGQPEGKQTIIAMLRTDKDRNYFTPESDAQKNIWFWRDLDAIATATGLELVPVNMDVLYQRPKGGMPIASDGLIKLRNDHLGYAITWFLIGISGLVIFVLYHYRVPSPAPEKTTL